MFVVYKRENGRFISIDTDGKECLTRDDAELLTHEQAIALSDTNPEWCIMEEDDWFSY